MKNLIIRNFKLRKKTIVLYSLLLIFAPIQLLINNDLLIIRILSSIVAMIILFVSLLDSGHAFRFHSRLGHKQSLDFFGSLPVSKKALLDSTYITILLFTLIGAGILSLYNIPSSTVSKTGISYSITLPFSYIAINLFAVPIAFKRNLEQKSENISYLVYLLIMILFIPFLMILIAVGIQSLIGHQPIFLNYLELLYKYGFLIISIIFFISNYFIQYKKISNHQKEAN
ncbi:phenol-soluble modulin export ABC transporter permease subunit PmtB [Staphylococcus gallinarum]|uniref:phenol-soluble modulin export ABC transporter permease subunit PmtB n=1 Tax=Staphylococcus gallinarum TaxID=1293 RepID=UPI001E60C03F|nr:ABC-2 transporter permease [Staphylococcus gallinarum]MCD8918758.1 ABC-2 transporter permease [Staphylococcus gallinarum]